MVRGRSPAVSPSWVPFPLNYVVIDQRNEIIKELKKYSKRKKIVLDKKQVDTVWVHIESALANYRGKSKDSPTPTIKERNKRVKKAMSLAAELIDTLGFYDDPHIFGFINRYMMLIGGEALELKKQLIALRDLPVTEAASKIDSRGKPKTRRILDNPKDDPYLDDLIFDLAHIWSDALGHPPNLTGVRHYQSPPAPQRSGPFYRWVVGILAVAYIFPPATKTVDNVVRELKQNT